MRAILAKEKKYDPDDISIPYDPDDISIPKYNDDPKHSLQKLADVFNRAMRKLGYRKRGNKLVLSQRKAAS